MPAWVRPYKPVGPVGVHYVDLSPTGNGMTEALDWLAPHELSYLDRIRSPKRQMSYVLCRSALRYLCCHSMGCSNEQLSFRKGAHGKPIAVIDGRDAIIHANVSHSGPHGLIAMAMGGPVGVDVEIRISNRDLAGIAESVFSPPELDALLRSKPDNRTALFYRIWTLKEAILKAEGSGLSLGPSSFTLPRSLLTQSGPETVILPGSPPTHWRAHSLDTPQFAAAVAYDPGCNP